jgi:energy-coupling factor transporter ATP-binding protein EcfA2
MKWYYYYPQWPEAEERITAYMKRRRMENIHQFIETDLYTEILNEVRNPRASTAVCLLGAKGVGKSTILKELHKYLKTHEASAHYYDLDNGENRDVLAEKLKELGKRCHEPCNSSTEWLFIDNIHVAAADVRLYSLISVFVKQSHMYCQIARLVCASSRHGLVDLKNQRGIKLNADDFTIIVVNPDERVALELVRRSQCDVFTEFQSETE